MFDALKKKLGGWFTKKEEEEPPKKKAKEEKSKKETKKPAKAEKVKETKKSEKKEKPQIKEKKPEKKEAKISKEVSKKALKQEKEETKEEIIELEQEIEEATEERIEEEVIETAKEEDMQEEKKEFVKEIKEKEGGWLNKWWKKKEEIKERQIVVPEEGSKEREDEKVDIEIKEEVSIEDDVESKEETPEEELKEELEEDSGFFGRLKKKLLANDLKKEEFEEIFSELEIILLENNVALEVVDKIKENLGKSLIGATVKKNDVEEKIRESLKEAILSVLIEGEDIIDKIKGSKEMPYVILFFGINGTGKTTSIAKVAYKLKKEGIGCVLAAGDTFRAASIEQLEKHAEKIGVPIVKSEYNSDPASVGFEAISYAKKHKIKVVLIDTAGRMYTKSNLMKEMEKIVKVTKPNLKVFVGESITGNDATEQAKMFAETAGIDGMILTKADVDEKSGTILSVSYVTGKPIFYLGVGQDYEDLQVFKKSDVLKGLGMD
mgnify:CR=1 FL=1